MKRIITLLFAVIVAHASFSAADMDKHLRVSAQNRNYLELSDGTPFIINGVNFCFVRNFSDDDKSFAELERLFKIYSENGVNFMRIWTSHPFYEFETSQGVFDETRLKRLDRLVGIAKKYGIRLKFCLHHFRTISADTNVKQPFFANTIYHKSNGGSFENAAEFFSTPKGLEVFCKRAEVLARRYGDEPTVAIIEVWNENDCVSAPLDKITEWTEKSLAMLKKIFPKKIVLQSLGSNCNDWSAKSYGAISAIKNNEIAQIHRYLDLGAQWSVCKGEMDILAAKAVESMRTSVADRPVLLAETGAVKPNHTGPFEFYEKDKKGTLLHDELFAPFFAGACGNGQAWHWDSYIEKNNLFWHFARFAKAVEGVDPIKERFYPVRLSGRDVRIYALVGKTVVLAWVRDTKSDWQSQLRDGKSPASRADVRVLLKWFRFDDTVKRVEYYNPWTGEERKVVMTSASFLIPEFKRSCVIRIVR